MIRRQMPKRRTYQFGGITFTSKNAVTEYVRGIRLAHEDKGPITDPIAVAVLTDLIRSHVDAEQKIGAGIKGFFVASAPDHPGTCFWIERVEGQPTDFGIPSCLHGPGPLNRRSLRMLVRPVVEAFRLQRLASCGVEFISDYSGSAFPIDAAVADHHPVTFEEIVMRFASKEGVDIDVELLTRSVDCSSEPAWCDPELPKRFLDFHSVFGLRLVHSRENLSEIKKEANVRLRTG